MPWGHPRAGGPKKFIFLNEDGRFEDAQKLDLNQPLFIAQSRKKTMRLTHRKQKKKRNMENMISMQNV